MASFGHSHMNNFREDVPDDTPKAKKNKVEKKKRDEKNTPQDELKNNSLAGIKLKNKLLPSIRKNTRIYHNQFVDLEFSLDLLKEFYEKTLKNYEKKQELNTEVLDELEPQKNLKNNEQVEFKNQEPGKKIEIELSIEVPVDSQCTSASKRKGKKRSQSFVKEMEIQLHLNIQQENDNKPNFNESDEQFTSFFNTFVNQQFNEYRNEFKNNNSPVEKEKLRNQFNKIQKLGTSLKFAENLTFLFFGSKSTYFEQLNKFEQYFLKLYEKITTNVEFEHKRNEDVSMQYDPGINADKKETSFKIMNEVRHNIQVDNIIKRTIATDSSEVIGKEKQLKLKSEAGMQIFYDKDEDFDINMDEFFYLVENHSLGVEENPKEVEECSDGEIKEFSRVKDEDSCIGIEGNHNEMEKNSEMIAEKDQNKIEGFDRVIDKECCKCIKGNFNKMEANFEMNTKSQNKMEKDSEVNIEGFDSVIGVDSCMYIEENQNEIKEDLDVDIESFDIVTDENSDVYIKENYDNFEVDSELGDEENQNEVEEDTVAEIVGFNEINVVECIIEDYLVECTSPIQINDLQNANTSSSYNSITSLEIDSPSCELINNLTENMFGIELEEIPTNEKFPNINIVNIENIGSKLKDFKPSLDVQNLKYIKDKTELSEQSSSFQNKFNGSLNHEYLKKQTLNGIESLNPESSVVLEEQQQTCSFFKDEISSAKKVRKELLKKGLPRESMKETETNRLLLKIKDFPDDLNKCINEDIVIKEIDQQQRECKELQCKFKSNLPFGNYAFSKQNSLEFESYQVLSQEGYNLFERLHAILRKKLIEYTSYNGWPYYCLNPFSLLDTLFEDSTEIKPNVFVITLYSEDIGYSIKITTNQNEPPVEKFYSYAEKDSILSYVELEQIPPQLRKDLNNANPPIFYSCCAIAEINYQVYGAPAKLHRVLLRPSNFTIQKYIRLITTADKSNQLSDTKKLQLESKMLLASFPCWDILSENSAAVNLQHQLLSSHSLELNPLTRKKKYSKYTIDLSLFNDPNDNLSENNENKSQRSSSTSINTVNNEFLLLMRCNIYVRSVKMFVLSALVLTENNEYSILISYNSNMESVRRLRFLINHESNEFDTYFSTFFKLAEKKYNFDVKLDQAYTFGQNEALCFLTHVPKLLNNNIYEPNALEQLFTLLLFNLYNFYTPVMKLDCQIYNKLKESENTKLNSKEMEDQFKESTRLCTIAKLSNDSTKFLDMSKSNLIEVENLARSINCSRPNPSGV